MQTPPLWFCEGDFGLPVMKTIFRCMGWLIPFFLAICTHAWADEVQFSGIHLEVPDAWLQTDTQLFSGSAPSQAWIFAQGHEEVVWAALVTEGVSSGLVDMATTVMIKSYLEAFAISWGGKVTGAQEGELAAYCGGEAGYHLEAKFGNDTYDYYGCMLMREDKWRAATLVTWIRREDVPDPEARALREASRRFEPFLKRIRFDAVF